MEDVVVDEEGRLPLPAEVREALGWQPGQEVHLHVEGGQLLAQPATAATSLKDEARRLSDAMRGLTLEVTRRVADAVGGEQKAGQPDAPAVVGPFHGTLPRLAEGVDLAPGATVL